MMDYQDICMDGRDRRDELEYGSAWHRILAGLVDWLLAIGVGVSVSIGAAIVFALFMLAFSGEYPFLTNFGAFLLYFGLPTTFLVLMMWFAVMAFRVSSKGETFGHRLLGLKIVKVGGKRMTLRGALIRQYLGSPLLCVYLTPMIVLVSGSLLLQLGDSTNPLDRIGEYTGGIAFVWLYLGLMVSAALTFANHALMIFDPEGQGWHDKLTGTVVVRNLKQDKAYPIADADLIDQN